MRRGIAYLLVGLAAGFLIYHILSSIVFAPVILTVFSPDDGDDIIDLIDSAESSIDIEIYVMSSRDVIEALERAKGRGVGIRIIIERNTMGDGNEMVYRELASKGFNIRYAGSAYKLTHSKFIIIDREAVLVGSHNLSNSALRKNREASVIIRDSRAVQDFIHAFETDWALAY
jgi:phosphatidylserine/phosphatidylglycerophosphate/cardiolipin synthase-like enzyme